MQQNQISLTRVRGDPVAHLLTVAGEIDLAFAPAVAKELRTIPGDDGPLVIVDLCDCLFIDSTGLSVLLSSQRNLVRTGGALAVVCPNATPLRVFEITRTDDTLNVSRDLNEALGRARSQRESLRAARERHAARKAARD